MLSQFNPHQPQTPFLSFIASILRAPRTEYTTDIALYIASNGSPHATNYRAGIVFMACIIGGFAFLWTFILVALKIKGKAVGCAAGHAFDRSSMSDDGSSLGRKSAKNECTDMEDNSTMRKSKTSSSSEDVVQNKGNGEQNRNSSSHEDEAEILSLHSSIPSVELDDERSIGFGSKKDSSSGRASSATHSTDTDLPPPSLRERRTQVVFFITGVITFLCVPLVIAFCFAPVKEAIAQSSSYLGEARQVASQIESSLFIIQEARNESYSIFNTTPMNMQVLCPELVNASNMNVTLGINLQAVISQFKVNYDAMQGQMSKDIAEVDSVVQTLNSAIDTVNLVFLDTSNYIWIAPAMLLVLCVVTALALFGVCIAWREESSAKLQRIMSFGVLPSLIVMSIACWATAICAAITTAMGTDACTNGTAGGSPENTIDEVLQAKGISPSSDLYSFVYAYTHTCKGPDPTTVLANLERQVQNLVDYIWNSLSKIDSTGRSNIMALCGNDELNVFLSNLGDLAKILTSINNAISSSTQVLQCDQISPFYVEAVHDSMCTNVSQAIAIAFVLFFALGITTLTMITLRAAWRQQIYEDKIYEESEVAENMIVDEHEEYLAYISRYRHEWQEYTGVDGVDLPRGPDDHRNVSPDGRTDSSSSEDELPNASPSDEMDGPSEVLEARQEPFDPYSGSDAQSQTTGGDISFQSLRTPTTTDGSPQQNPVSIPPSLLLPMDQHTDYDNLLDDPLFDEIPPTVSSDSNTKKINSAVSNVDSVYTDYTRHSQYTHKTISAYSLPPAVQSYDYVAKVEIESDDSGESPTRDIVYQQDGNFEVVSPRKRLARGVTSNFAQRQGGALDEENASAVGSRYRPGTPPPRSIVTTSPRSKGPTLPRPSSPASRSLANEGLSSARLGLGVHMRRSPRTADSLGSSTLERSPSPRVFMSSKRSPSSLRSPSSSSSSMMVRPSSPLPPSYRKGVTVKDFHKLRAASPTTPGETIPTSAEDDDSSGVSPTKFLSGSPRFNNTTLSKRGIQIMQDLDAMGGGVNGSLEVVVSKERSTATFSPRKRMALSSRHQSPGVVVTAATAAAGDDASVQFSTEQQDES